MGVSKFVEYKNPVQHPNEPRRRCFASDLFDLTVWYYEEKKKGIFKKERLRGFQLCFRTHSTSTDNEFIFEYKKNSEGLKTYFYGVSKKEIAGDSLEGFPGRAFIEETSAIRPSRLLCERFAEAGVSLPKEVFRLVQEQLELKKGVQ